MGMNFLHMMKAQYWLENTKIKNKSDCKIIYAKEDLEKIPLLKREDIKNCNLCLMCINICQCISGSPKMASFGRVAFYYRLWADTFIKNV